MLLLRQALLAALAATATGWTLQPPRSLRAAPPLCMARDDSAGRGFGPAAKPPPKKAKGAQPAAGAAAPPAAAAGEDASLRAAEARGREYLEAMRREAGEAKDAKPKRWAADELTEEELRVIDPTEGVMPEAVSNRMLGRVLPFAGLPIAGAFVLFVGFWFANTQLDLDLPPQIVAYSTQALFFLSFAGISWGVMSTSWDEEEEGSLLGLEEVKRNTQLMRGDLAAGRNEAEAMYQEEDAAADGVIMSKRALRKVEAAARREAKDK